MAARQPLLSIRMMGKKVDSSKSEIWRVAVGMAVGVDIAVGKGVEVAVAIRVAVGVLVAGASDVAHRSTPVPSVGGEIGLSPTTIVAPGVSVKIVSSSSIIITFCVRSGAGRHHK